MGIPETDFDDCMETAYEVWQSHFHGMLARVYRYRRSNGDHVGAGIWDDVRNEALLWLHIFGMKDEGYSPFQIIRAINNRLVSVIIRSRAYSHSWNDRIPHISLDEFDAERLAYSAIPGGQTASSLFNPCFEEQSIDAIRMRELIQEHLDPIDQFTLSLHVHGYTQKEIAEELKVERSTVSRNLKSIKAILRGRMNGDS